MGQRKALLLFSSCRPAVPISVLTTNLGMHFVLLSSLKRASNSSFYFNKKATFSNREVGM